MTCIKCGLEIDSPAKTCPRCGTLLAQIKVERDGMEAGSLDAWSGDIINKKETVINNEDLSFFQMHPSALLFVGALGIRIIFYVIALLLMLLNISLWDGLGVLINLMIASAATFIVIAQPEEQDFYWLKPVSTILILVDTGVTLMIALSPIVAKILELLSRFV